MTTGRLFFDKRYFRIRIAEIGCASISEFARNAKLSRSTVLQISAGLLPSEAYRKKFAAKLGCDVADLWREVPEHVLDGGA